ncbi:SEC-C metal-binding domain-containing protein [Dyella sp.]|uniref:SEC-C metal-binding domain-containing protein n=1 Tax=Dyella sp. TaxID=1869338 RepID=UPI0039C85FEE
MCHVNQQFQLSSALVNAAKAIPPSSASRKAIASFTATRSCFEKLGRNDPCPCGSARLFQKLLHALGQLRRCTAALLRKMRKGGFGRPRTPVGWDAIPAQQAIRLLGFHPSLHGRYVS